MHQTGLFSLQQQWYLPRVSGFKFCLRHSCRRQRHAVLGFWVAARLLESEEPKSFNLQASWSPKSIHGYIMLFPVTSASRFSKCSALSAAHLLSQTRGRMRLRFPIAAKRAALAIIAFTDCCWVSDLYRYLIPVPKIWMRRALHWKVPKQWFFRLVHWWRGILFSIASSAIGGGCMITVSPPRLGRDEIRVDELLVLMDVSGLCSHDSVWYMSHTKHWCLIYVRNGVFAIFAFETINPQWHNTHNTHPFCISHLRQWLSGVVESPCMGLSKSWRVYLHEEVFWRWTKKREQWAPMLGPRFPEKLRLDSIENQEIY